MKYTKKTIRKKEKKKEGAKILGDRRLVLSSKTHDRPELTRWRARIFLICDTPKTRDPSFVFVGNILRTSDDEDEDEASETRTKIKIQNNIRSSGKVRNVIEFIFFAEDRFPKMATSKKKRKHGADTFFFVF